MDRKKVLLTAGLTLFLIGAIWGGLWLGSRIASRIGAGAVNIVSSLGEPMPYSCPHVLALHETGTLTASVHNSSPDPLTYDVSFSSLLESAQMTLPGCRTSLTIEPGKTAIAACDVKPYNTPVFITGDVISIRASALPVDESGQSLVAQGRPLYQATCIIDVTRAPNRTGKQAVAGTLWLILIMLMVGPVLWIAGARPFNIWKIILLILFMVAALGWIAVVFWYLGR